MSTRKQILDEATKIITTDREQRYGSVESNFALIAEYWNVYLGRKCIRPEDVGIMMALMKIARIQTGRYKADSYIDACGYIALAGELSADPLGDDWGDTD